ncbi:MAG: ABC transporter substrate-binding protein [Alphaproteobacteria bacterium]|nr:ABC transporter substrate-binding protein [Alphaproteobacteria bacterium]
MIGLLVVLASAHDVRADQAENARKFIQNLGDTAIKILSDKNVTKEAAAKTFHDMLVEDFDLDLLGKFALGPTNWRSATPAQRQEYQKLFEKLVVQIYNDRFSLYHGETWKVVDGKPEDDRDTYVSGLIIKPNPSAPPVKVDWRVRNKGGHQQVIDVIVEGVSMTVTQRSEFAAVIQKNGGDLDAFLKTLSDRVIASAPEHSD